MIHHIAPVDIFISLLIFGLQGLVLSELITKETKFLSLKSYLAFCLLRSAILWSIILFYPYASYWHPFWKGQSIGFVFQIWIATTLMRSLVAGKPMIRLMAAWSITVMLIAIIAKADNSLHWFTWVPMWTWGDLAVWFLLLYSLMLSNEWRPIYSGIALGLAASVVMHFVFVVIQGNNNPGGVLRRCYPVAALVELIIWTWTVYRKPRPAVVS